MKDFREKVDKILKEHIYDGHENCDDSCAKKADYNDLIDELTKLYTEYMLEIIDNETSWIKVREKIEELTGKDL